MSEIWYFIFYDIFNSYSNGNCFRYFESGLLDGFFEKHKEDFYKYLTVNVEEVQIYPVKCYNKYDITLAKEKFLEKAKQSTGMQNNF